MNHRTEWGALNGAPTQYDRLIRSVGADSVLVDQRSFCDLLNFAPQFGKLINFFDAKDRPDGDWSQFFLNDPTMILAAIVAFDLDAFEIKLWNAFRLARQPQPLPEAIKRLWECCEMILRLVLLLDGWHWGAPSPAATRPARLLESHLQTTIDAGLRSHLHQLMAVSQRIAASGHVEESNNQDFHNLSPTWRIQDATAQDVFPWSEFAEEIIDDIVDLLEVIAEAFILVFRQLQSFAAELLPATLLESDHKPQIALYIAFAQLFETAQNTVNTVTQRFTHFYYEDVLRENPSGPTPDHVYVVVALDPALGEGGSAVIPAGTLFSAGKEPDGSPILYASDKTVSVSAATIAVVKAINVVMATDNVIRQVFGTTIDVALMNQEAVGKGLPTGLVGWPTFGYSAAEASEIAATAPVTLGFAVTSNYLMLTAGNRTIKLTFWLPESELLGNFADEIQAAATSTGLESIDIFNKVVESALKLWFSTTTGWFTPDALKCTSLFDDKGAFISLEVLLEPDAPPIVAYDPAPDAPAPAEPQPPDSLNPNPQLPSVKAYLDQSPVMVTGPFGSIEVFPLALLSPIEFQELEIWTQTTGLTDLTVTTSGGTVDTTKPFPIFGGVPVLDSYLQFGCDELFVKQPVSGSLSITLTWYGLPNNDTGFRGYYIGYVIGPDGQKHDGVLFDNQSFRGQIQVVNPGLWVIPPPAASTVEPDDDPYLFRTQEKCADPKPISDGPLCTATAFLDLPTKTADAGQFYEPADSSIQLLLTGPSYAFGNTLYAPNVMNAAIEDLPKPWWPSLIDEGCQPLADTADALEKLVHPVNEIALTKAEMIAAIKQIQVRVVQTAENFLAKCFGSYSAELADWVRVTFYVSGISPPPYRARIIGNRLRSALNSIQTGESPAPNIVFPAVAPEAIQLTVTLLDSVIWLQHALDAAAPEPDGSYIVAIQTQLSIVVQKLRQAYAAGMAAKKKVPYPNPPWLPQAQLISIDYNASCKISSAGETDPCGTYYYLLPDGGYCRPNSTSGPLSLFSVPRENSLNLGFSDMEAMQQLNLLIQMQAYNGENPPTVGWQYLEPEGWKPFESSQIPLDTTNGLQNTGLLNLNLPQAVPTDPSGATDGYRWIRAVTESPTAFPDSIGIYPHVLTATWSDAQGGSGEHLDRPLPPYSITSSIQELPGIITITNPMSSSGGLPSQTPETFRNTLSERLRHKDRAILPWDYEQLVLEEFPTIWQAQALSATNSSGEAMPGDVLVMVVGGSQLAQSTEPTAPIVSSDVLEQIRAFLSVRSSPFAQIVVVNPVYVRIKVNAEVVFDDTDGSGGSENRLNSDLVKYLSPWFYSVDRALLGASYATVDAIRQFIQTRPYVEFLLNIQFSYDPLPDTLNWYFLTSAVTHQITAAQPSLLP